GFSRSSTWSRITESCRSFVWRPLGADAAWGSILLLSRRSGCHGLRKNGSNGVVALTSAQAEHRLQQPFGDHLGLFVVAQDIAAGLLGEPPDIGIHAEAQGADLVREAQHFGGVGGHHRHHLLHFVRPACAERSCAEAVVANRTASLPPGTAFKRMKRPCALGGRASSCDE